MCLLSYFPGGIKPDPDALHNGAIFNDDGHGFAIVDRRGSRIIVDRGMNAKEMIDTFVTMRTLYPDGPALFHSRLTTDGLTTLTNCHPFEIGGDSRTVLAHNGIMPLRPSKGDPRSDTRIVAESYIPRAYGTLRRRRARLAFERWMGKWNKAVILTVDPRFRDNGFILNEKEGIWDTSGAWYSNSMFETIYRPQVRAWDDRDEWEPYWTRSPGLTGKCWACQNPVDYRIHGECPKCCVCFDCGEMPDRCQCYVPTRRLDPSPTSTMSDLRSMG